MTMQTNQTNQTNNGMKLENFDEIWGQIGNPVLVEKKFIELLPQAQSLENKSIYLQMLSQLALAQALMKKFDLAHATLDDAQAQLTSDCNLARVRIFLERGRVFQQAGDVVQALTYFEKSYELSEQHKFDIQTINAAHMIAIIADTTANKILWNQRAIDLATTTDDLEGRRWLGSVWNNIGANYLEDKQYEKALHAFEKTLEYRLQENYAPNVRFAKFRIGQILRILGHLDQALMVQQELLLAYEAIVKTGKLDMPVEMFTLTRGWVYEEFIELYHAAIKGYAKLAYADLASNEMFAKTESARLERLQKIQNS
jgi:tetratricopeptide (TPR) repeat protein